jgi:hypothetical protein
MNESSTAKRRRSLPTLFAIACIVATAVTTPAHADGWRSPEQVLGLELSAGIYAPTSERVERQYGTGFSGRATLHASLRPGGQTWFAWSLGYRRTTGQIVETPDTFEVDDAEVNMVPMTVGAYFDLIHRHHANEDRYPLAFHAGAGLEFLWVDWSIPEAVPADNVEDQIVLGPYIELLPTLDMNKFRITFRSRISLLGNAGYDSIALDDVNFSGLQLELGLIRRLN